MPDGAVSGPSPAESLDRVDVGDDTQRRFRYQHAYGVILLAAAASKAKSIACVWCENHDDFVGELEDGSFESYQVKTRKPENGPWKLNDDGLKKSIVRFVSIDASFPGLFSAFHFVSNLDCASTTKGKGVALSPVSLFQEVRHGVESGDLSGDAQAYVNELSATSGEDVEAVFLVLKRTRLVKGPSLDDYEAVVAHQHLSRVPGCSGMSPAQLDGLRDELIQRVFTACSLSVDDPSKHWCCAVSDDRSNPTLAAKSILPQLVVDLVSEQKGPPFRYLPLDASLAVGGGGRTLSAMERKLIKGGLANYIPNFKRRAVSAERHLLGLALVDPEGLEAVLGILRAS